MVALPRIDHQGAKPQLAAAEIQRLMDEVEMLRDTKYRLETEIAQLRRHASALAARAMQSDRFEESARMRAEELSELRDRTAELAQRVAEQDEWRARYQVLSAEAEVLTDIACEREEWRDKYRQLVASNASRLMSRLRGLITSVKRR